MLQKPPGSTTTANANGTSSTPRSTTRNKQINKETPDEMIKKLSRLPINKKCCDCTSKFPNIVNVTIGAFLCTTCAGIHRELPNTPRAKALLRISFYETLKKLYVTYDVANYWSLVFQQIKTLLFMFSSSSLQSHVTAISYQKNDVNNNGCVGTY